MVGYLDWAQVVLRVVLRERPVETPLMLEELAEELGIPLTTLSGPELNEVILGLDHVLTDLRPHGLVDYPPEGHYVGYSPRARRYRIEPLSAAWQELRSGYLDPDEEAFLAALAHESERPGDIQADVVHVPIRDVVAALGWDWDNAKALAIYRHLLDRHYVAGRVFADGGDVRITYAGLVRALDDAGGLLREASEHLQAHRLRAAGCIAAVELERRLKHLVGHPVTPSRGRDPGVEDYNRALYKAGVIDQSTWQLITTLAVTRKLCVHVLDREPEIDEIQFLLENVERILRRYPVP